MNRSIRGAVALGLSERELLLMRVVVDWAGSRNPAGYGEWRFNGRREYVHRVAYRLWGGELDDDLELDHKCRNTGCCNPLHLEQVEHRENIARAYRSKRCKRGHELTPQNTYTDGRCRECRLAWQKGRRAAA